jgi:hypothetical protein
MIFRQTGFSIIHALPLIAIVAVIAIVGVKIMNQSKAATLRGVVYNVSYSAGTYVKYRCWNGTIFTNLAVGSDSTARCGDADAYYVAVCARTSTTGGSTIVVRKGPAWFLVANGTTVRVDQRYTYPC